VGRSLTVIEPPSLRRISLGRELGRLRHFGDLFWTLSLHRIRVRYKQSRLGIAWALLQPLALMLVFALMFRFLRGTPHHGVPYAVFAYSALLPWSAFSGGLSSATGALTGHAGLLTKVYFPREILPLTYVVAALADFTIASTALAVLMTWYGIGLTPLALWALPALLVLTTFLTGAGLLLSAFQVRYRDVGIAMPVILQVWLFASPVLYPLDAVRATLPSPLYALYVFNPIAGAIDTFRRAIVLQQPPDFYALAVSAAVAAALLPVAYLYFKYAEQTLADVV
jgi:lipopolysaccharide transport system permease protein